MNKISSQILLAFSIIILSGYQLLAVPVITLTPESPNIICASGNSDTLSYSISANEIPSNTNIVIYQSTDSTFNPSAGQGDSIGYILGNSIPQDTVNFGNCVKTLGIFIDACGAAGLEGRNEYIVLTSGKGIKVSNLAIDFSSQNNGGATNADINTGANPCGYKVPSAALIAGLRVGTCNASNVIPASPTDSIPANAIILLFTSDNVTADYGISGLCNLGYPIYVLQSACERTIGAFTNAPRCDAPSRYRTTVAIDKRLNCSDNFTYDLCGIYNEDGTYAIRQPGTDTASVANNGIRINAIDSCGGIDYTQFNFSADTTLKFKIPLAFCNTGFHYLKATLNPNTNPVTISNMISFKYVCNDITLTPRTTTICSGDSALVNISSTDPNASFSWTVSGSPNISGASAGNGNIIKQLLTNTGTTPASVTYNVTSMDAGCTATSSVTITVRAPIVPVITGNTLICNGNATTLNVAGQFDSVRWNTGASSASINVLQPGIYTVNAYANGCKGTTSATTTSAAVSVSISGSLTICNAGTTVLTAVGQFDSVRWNTNAVTSAITVNQGGTFSVTAYLNSCSGMASVDVVTGSVNVAISGNTTICNGAPTTLSVAGTYDSLRWNTNETSAAISVLQAGSYSVIAYQNGCSGTASVDVTSGTVGVTIAGNNFICNGGSTTLSVTGSFDSIRWNTNETSSSINVTSTGLYSVTVYQNGCSGTDRTDVDDRVLTVEIDGNLSLCTNGATNLSVSGQFDSIRWSTGEVTTSIDVDVAAEYTVTVYNNGCSASATAEVVEVSLPVSISGNLSICPNQSTSLNAGDGFDSYLWQPNGEISQTINADAPGKYVVTVSKDGCSGKDSVTVTTLNLPPAFSLGNDTAFCGDFTTVLSTGNQTTVWNTNFTGAQISVSTAGTYIASISNACGIVSDTIVISKNELPQIFIGNDTAFCEGEIILRVGGDFTSYVWSTGDETSSISVSEEGEYSVTVTDENGCTNTVRILITSNCLNNVWLPNAFSPNGDGANDVFYVRGNAKNTSIEKFVIFNRWGNKVFESNNSLPDNPSNGWDGKNKNEVAQVEVYSYYVIAKFSDGTKKTLKGNVTLVQ